MTNDKILEAKWLDPRVQSGVRRPAPADHRAPLPKRSGSTRISDVTNNKVITFCTKSQDKSWKRGLSNSGAARASNWQPSPSPRVYLQCRSERKKKLAIAERTKVQAHGFEPPKVTKRQENCTQTRKQILPTRHRRPTPTPRSATAVGVGVSPSRYMQQVQLAAKDLFAFIKASYYSNLHPFVIFLHQTTAFPPSPQPATCACHTQATGAASPNLRPKAPIYPDTHYSLFPNSLPLKRPAQRALSTENQSHSSSQLLTAYTCLPVLLAALAHTGSPPSPPEPSKLPPVPVPSPRSPRLLRCAGSENSIDSQPEEKLRSCTLCLNRTPSGGLTVFEGPCCCCSCSCGCSRIVALRVKRRRLEAQPPRSDGGCSKKLAANPEKIVSSTLGICNKAGAIGQKELNQGQMRRRKSEIYI